MKTLERFLNWLKEVKERLTDKETNVFAIVSAIAGIIIYIFAIEPETVNLIVEQLKVIYDNIGQIAATLGVILSGILTIYKAFSKTKKDN